MNKIYQRMLCMKIEMHEYYFLEYILYRYVIVSFHIEVNFQRLPDFK